MRTYLVYYSNNNEILSQKVIASSYAAAVINIPTWLQIEKLPEDPLVALKLR